MSSTRYPLCVLMACILICNFMQLGFADEPSDDLTTDRVRMLNQKANQINTALQQVCAKYNLRFTEPKKFTATWVKDRPEPQTTFVMFLVGGETALTLGKTGYSFRDEDNQLTHFGHYNDDDAPELKAIYDTIQPPKWTPSYATEIATAYESVLPIPKGVFLSTPEVEFRQDNQDGEKHGVGHWWFTWWRMDSHGNFLYDHICISMAEGFAPQGGSILLSTPFHEIESAPLSEDEAFNRIKRPGCTLNRSTLRGVVPMEGPFARKEIRLVWEFWFDPPAPPPTPSYVTVWNYLRSWSWVAKIFGPPSERISDAYEFSIWIDAHTGEEVGGDAEM